MRILCIVDPKLSPGAAELASVYCERLSDVHIVEKVASLAAGKAFESPALTWFFTEKTLTPTQIDKIKKLVSTPFVIIRFELPLTSFSIKGEVFQPFPRALTPADSVRRIFREFEKRGKPLVFLTILTRHHPKRVNLLKCCKASVRRLVDPDYEHVIIETDGSQGKDGGNKIFETHRAQYAVNGSYVLTLDDDDIIIRPELVDELKGIIALADKPCGIIYFRGSTAAGIVPRYVPPRGGYATNHIGSFCGVVRRDVWERNYRTWSSHPGAGDANFLRACHITVEQAEEGICMHAELVCQSLVRSHGESGINNIQTLREIVVKGEVEWLLPILE